MKENQKIARTDLAIEAGAAAVWKRKNCRKDSRYTLKRTERWKSPACRLPLPKLLSNCKALRQIHHHPDPTLVEQPAGPAAGDRRGSRLHPLSAAAGGNGAGGRAGNSSITPERWDRRWRSISWSPAI